MSWTDDLADRIEAALDAGGPHEILVQSEAQAEMGQRAAERMAENRGADWSLLTFVVVPADPYAP